MTIGFVGLPRGKRSMRCGLAIKFTGPNAMLLAAQAGIHNLVTSLSFLLVAGWGKTWGNGKAWNYEV